MAELLEIKALPGSMRGDGGGGGGGSGNGGAPAGDMVLTRLDQVTNSFITGR